MFCVFLKKKKVHFHTQVFFKKKEKKKKKKEFKFVKSELNVFTYK